MSIFKENDIRGLYPGDWDKNTAYEIGTCLPDIIPGKNIVIGWDGRESSVEIYEYLTRGLTDRGINVTDIGRVDTPAVYFSVGNYSFDGGIMITASHNPVEYNGIKITGKGASPIEYSSGLKKLEELVLGKVQEEKNEPAEVKYLDIKDDYVRYLKGFQTSKKKVKAVFDCSNGAAGRFINDILDGFPGEAVVINSEIDGSFPNHGPNPVLIKNLKQLRAKVRETDSEIGFCFDGDADRVVMIDNSGEIISPDLLTAIIGLYYFKLHPEEISGNKTVLVDIRSSNSIREFLAELGADVEICPVGHGKIKKLMRDYQALFAGELTGHYYYRENFYSDSAWLSIFRVLSVLSEGSKSLQELENEIMQYHFSGEINFRIDHKDQVIERLLKKYADAEIDNLDGYRFNYPDWWFIIRKSGTEPFIRLVVEADSKDLLDLKVDEITIIINSYQVLINAE
ncbi:MAG: phosphomannomutase/phosphoglucomutase [Spirochaetales bacterium]|nr:phosphomannomutase/phosphoglucomutase [Spirochaetales bacterium]